MKVSEESWECFRRRFLRLRRKDPLPEVKGTPLAIFSPTASANGNGTSSSSDADISAVVLADADGDEGNPKPAKRAKVDASDDSNDTNKVNVSSVDPPPEYMCNILHELMADPVTTPDGLAYERQAIVRWIKAEAKADGAAPDPITRQLGLRESDLRPNVQLRQLIERNFPALVAERKAELGLTE